MSTSANSSGDSALLNGFANHDAVLFKLLRQNGVEEWIATRV